MYDENITYISKRNKYTNMDEQITGLRQVVVENFRVMAREGCYKLIIPGEPELLSRVSEILRSNFGENVSIYLSRKYFLQVMPAEADKAAALAKVVALMGLGPENVMAIGDSVNDEAMIRWAGIGVAMANGSERIKSVADIVTEKTNDEDGVAEIIEKYFL
jgi:Cof subfamily protein (haloacid dehalogenase superfamily)